MGLQFRDLTEEKRWVVVSGLKVSEYETWHQALKSQLEDGGNLMSKNYYENHYKIEHNG